MGIGLNGTFKMAANEFGSQGDIEVLDSFLHIDLGVTLCDLSVAVTVFGVSYGR